MLSNLSREPITKPTARRNLTATILGLIFSLLMIPSAFAQEAGAGSQDPIVTSLKTSRRLTRKEREHWYNLRGPERFTYATADGGTVELPYRIKKVKDERPYKQRAPYKHRANQVRGVVMWCAPFWSLAWGAYNVSTGGR